jgi:hypothetical protein
MRHQLLQRTTAAGLLAAALIAPALAQGTYQVPLETRDALESLLPAADLVARARFGDDAPGYFAELGLGTARSPGPSTGTPTGARTSPSTCACATTASGARTSWSAARR